MHWWMAAWLMAGCICLEAQTVMPIGIVRGSVVALIGSARSGELDIRSSQSLVYSCLYDARTYFERDHRAIGVTGLSAGDPVEVVADRRPGSGACYTRIVEVVEKSVRHAPSMESPPLRGNLTFGGMVLQRNLSRMTMRTRDGEISLILRPDTYYIDDGIRVENSPGLVNKHVFVRAGRDIYGHLEAYQIMWAEEMTGN
jgi:hypothetical protein